MAGIFWNQNSTKQNEAKWSVRELYEIEKIKKINFLFLLSFILFFILISSIVAWFLIKPFPELIKYEEKLVEKKVIETRIIENKINIYHMNDYTNLEFSYNNQTIKTTLGLLKEWIAKNPDRAKSLITLLKIEDESLIQQVTIKQLIEGKLSFEERQVVEDEKKKQELLELDKLKQSWSWTLNQSWVIQPQK